MKIQINSLEALERLIGNDNELEIEIRNSVVESFAKKNLRALANDEVYKKVATAFSVEVTNRLVNTISDQWGHTKSFTLRPEIKNLLIDHINQVKNDQINAAVAEFFDKNVFLKELNAKLEASATFIANQLTDATMERKINLLVDKKIKAKLGL